ncbi:MAG: L-2-amino-thiazoline-4-carboxylic acid hydrolase [Thermodesulfobacteriota bacterium]
MSFTLPQIERRRIEAAMLKRVYDALCETMPADQAAAHIERAIAADARTAGEAFAASAPEGPSLAHFATVVGRWTEGGALDVHGLKLDGDALTFTVTRCGYADMYRDMGLPRPLSPLLSCLRDKHFAAGYSPHLTMTRPATIVEGGSECPFRYEWVE